MIKMTDKQIEQIWIGLEDIPITNDELDDDYFVWDCGTTKDEIWKWFDKHHSKGVGWLVNEFEVEE
jgi:hypothetical protein